jgi:hypothetical protein
MNVRIYSAPMGPLGYCTPSEAEGWGYYDVAPMGLLGYCTPSEAEGWGYCDYAPMGLLIISATIFPLLITPGRPAPGCVPAPTI